MQFVVSSLLNGISYGLLAYATSPGNIASDGSGKNGLYTENLVRELSQRSARIEDALKRVRLNVRLASSGEQIPFAPERGLAGPNGRS